MLYLLLFRLSYAVKATEEEENLMNESIDNNNVYWAALGFDNQV